MHYRLLSLIMVAVIAFGIGGCGGGDGSTSADPLETDSLTLTSSATQVDFKETVTLTATVKNASGAPVVGRRVSFDFAANASGAVLSAYSDYTDSSGVASVVYTAGMADGFDIVKAKISNGSSMVANISVADPLGIDSLTLTSDAAKQVDYLGTVKLTATVIDASGDGVVGREVSFEFLSNPSGATLSSSIVKTGFGGVASVIYTAGRANGIDVVRATISNGSSMITNITVASAAGGGTEVTTTSYGISVNALPSWITAMGGQSVVEATVGKTEVNSSGSTKTNPVSGVTVNFSVVPGGSALGSVSPVSAITDASGKAITTYKGGAVVAGSDYSDVVQASLTTGGVTYPAAVQIDYRP